jgi:hypothetical protein
LNPGVGNGARFGFLMLAHPFRWRLTNASIEKGAKFGSLTLTRGKEERKKTRD